ncbi:putative leucine-rich repeat-containing protein DDB_G0290503 [Pectinophora gossypiella]|uniref:putative leucine-rich repeat-containing protein DDB_G0290503 n=1 Tax=Pectinophora gossypiella TaxID=13191 RepID=UPI00214E40C0|nr:putative leucine-rich repeat-containing protein DDB_G0290503 [Pectinophora gossypiella]
MQRVGPSPAGGATAGGPGGPRSPPQRARHCRADRLPKCCLPANVKKSRSCSPMELEVPMTRQIRDIHNDMRSSARIIKDSRARLLEIQKKSVLSEADVKELGDRHELLLREMERFDRLTRNVQRLVDLEVTTLRRARDGARGSCDCLPAAVYGMCAPPPDHPTCAPAPPPRRASLTVTVVAEPALYHEMKMPHPTVLVGRAPPPHAAAGADPARCKSEIDLTRKLSESYDMQEKLVADNADLEVKRYILYKELMTKDQTLETSRAQIKRLQAELKLMSQENALLHERLDRNHPEDLKDCQQLTLKLASYQSSTSELVKQVGELESEVKSVRGEMDELKKAAEATAAAGAGGPACKAAKGANSCFTPSGGPPCPPMTKACGVCPPCPAPCNPNAPPTPAEKEVARLTIQLRQTEENFKTKVTECAMLRSELMKKKEELEKERCQHREVANKLRELEMKFEGLTTHTNMMLGTKEQALEHEVNVRALKQCYREAREEIDELRLLMKEQNDQLQDYRVKYMQAQQLVEEQRRQMDLMDMDNTRISEQINLEIQKVKLKFQEKLQELAPIPDLLKATQMRLKDAQQAQAIAEHNAEQLARELNCAREKVHILLHNTVKPPEKTPEQRGADEKQLALLQQRIAQLTDTNLSLKAEIERLKANVIRMEESVLANEKRLQEKMHECAQLGGELDRSRDDAARALQRSNERMETIRKCLQTTVAELERQLAAARAQVKSSEKEREELQCRLNCQIKRLKDNFDQAQLRIMALTTQVATLRHSAGSDAGDGEGDVDNFECLCKTMFERP